MGSENLQRIAIGVGVFLLGFFGSYLILSNTVKKKVVTNIPQQEKIEEIVKQNVVPNSETPPKNTESYNVILLGSGGSGHSGGGLTDSIILININPTDKKAALISIPRDTWTSGNYKINASMVNGGYDNLRGIIQNITGLRTNYFVSTDFSGLTNLINSYESIEVEIPKTFDDPLYPIKGEENNTCGKTEAEINTLKSQYSDFNLEKQFTCRYEHLHFEKGKIAVNGETALKIARSRHGDSDFGRSARQFAILKGFLAKLISIDGFKNIENTFNTIIKSVKTNADLATVKDLAQIFGDPKSYQIKEIQLTDQNVFVSSKSQAGAYILIPKAGINNFDEVKKYIQDNLN